MFCLVYYPWYTGVVAVTQSCPLWSAENNLYEKQVCEKSKVEHQLLPSNAVVASVADNSTSVVLMQRGDVAGE